MKKILLLLLTLGAFSATLIAQPGTSVRTTLLTNVQYGSDERNVFDIWLVESDKPVPVAIYVHGGGFITGNKELLPSGELRQLLANGISVATVNYGYCTGKEEGALACMYDVKRAVQYIRSRAEEWNIDKEQIGMWGESAGAGITLWLGFHKEMAQPRSADPVLRESSRLQAVCGIGCQSTYDVFQWPDLFGVDMNGKMMADLHRIWSKNWLGIKSMDEKNSKNCKKLRKELDIISMITPDDPPFYVWNTVPGDMPPTKLGVMIHHPLFAKLLYEKGQKCKIECHAFTPKAPEYGLNANMTAADFFIKYLKK